MNTERRSVFEEEQSARAIAEFKCAICRGMDHGRAESTAWERVYNTIRPHQALGYRTPHEFLQELAGASPR